MNDDNTAPLPQDDDKYDAQTNRLRSRYAQGELVEDDLEESDLLPESAELDSGLGKDQFDTEDVDEDTLPADDDNEETDSGLDEEDSSSIGKQNQGDEIMRPEDSISEPSPSEASSDIQDFAGLEDKYLEEDEPTDKDLEALEK
jgi:hypothetical protein